MKIVAVHRKGLLYKYDNEVLCDNESSVSIFHNKDLITNIRTVSENIEVFGIENSLTVDMIGLTGIWSFVFSSRSSRKYIMLLRPA